MIALKQSLRPKPILTLQQTPQLLNPNPQNISRRPRKSPHLAFADKEQQRGQEKVCTL
jgi:hypothetical protein